MSITRRTPGSVWNRGSVNITTRGGGGGPRGAQGTPPEKRDRDAMAIMLKPSAAGSTLRGGRFPAVRAWAAGGLRTGTQGASAYSEAGEQPATAASDASSGRAAPTLHRFRKSIRSSTSAGLGFTL